MEILEHKTNSMNDIKNNDCLCHHLQFQVLVLNFIINYAKHNYCIANSRNFYFMYNRQDYDHISFFMISYLL